MDIIELKINGIHVTKVETLTMKDDDVLFVTYTGDVVPDMLGHLHKMLVEMLGHERIMIMHKSFDLQVVSGAEKEEGKNGDGNGNEKKNKITLVEK